MTFDYDLLTLLREFREVLTEFSPNGYVYESSDLLTLTFAIVIKLIVSDGSRSDRSVGTSISLGWVSDKVTSTDDAIDVHTYMRC